MHLELLSRSATDACRDVDGGIVAHIGESTVTITMGKLVGDVENYHYVVQMGNLTIDGRRPTYDDYANDYVGILHEWVRFALDSADRCTYYILAGHGNSAMPIDVWAFAHATELQQLADALTRKVIADDRPDRPRASEWLHLREDES